MLKMISDNKSDDSDTDSLPDLSQLLRPPPPSKDISSGDIVWAKFKHLYWPALVRTVYPKQKKITIWYADEPGKTFKLPLKNVCPFNDSEMVAKIQKDVREAGCIQEHEGLTSHAMRYLIRKDEGRNDDPMKFFDQTFPFFLVEEWLQKNPGADVSNIKIPPLYITHERKQSIRKRVNSHKEISDDSEVESTDSEGIPKEKAATTDYLTKVTAHLQENPSDPSKDEFIDKIIECILSGKGDAYLQKVMSKYIPSEHHNIYEQSIKNKNKKLSDITYTGPIEDDDKLRKLIFYLLPLYDSMHGTRRNRRSASKKSVSAISASSSFDKKSDAAQYVASVWLPESIIFAISIIKKVSIKKARELFNEKSESKTKAVENILASLDLLSGESNVADISASDETSFNQNDEKKQLEDLKHTSDSTICSPLKKICIGQSETVEDNENISKDLGVSFETPELSDDLKSFKRCEIEKHIPVSDYKVEQLVSAQSSNLKCNTVFLRKTPKKAKRRKKSKY